MISPYSFDKGSTRAFSSDPWSLTSESRSALSGRGLHCGGHGGVAHRARREYRQFAEHLLGPGLALRLRQRQVSLHAAAHLREIDGIRGVAQVLEQEAMRAFAFH